MFAAENYVFLERKNDTERGKLTHAHTQSRNQKTIVHHSFFTKIYSTKEM